MDDSNAEMIVIQTSFADVPLDDLAAATPLHVAVPRGWLRDGRASVAVAGGGAPSDCGSWAVYASVGGGTISVHGSVAPEGFSPQGSPIPDAAVDAVWHRVPERLSARVVLPAAGDRPRTGLMVVGQDVTVEDVEAAVRGLVVLTEPTGATDP